MDRSSLLTPFKLPIRSRKPAVSGHVDRAEGSCLVGWVWDSNHPGERLTVDAYLDGRVVASTVANIFRPDLEPAGVGDGSYGFRCELPPLDGSIERIEVQLKVRDTETLLKFNNSTDIPLESSVFLTLIVADLVNNCNLRCPFCVVDYSGVTKTELMTEETFQSLLRLIRSVPEAGFILSCLHEPTLHPRLNQFIEMIPRDCRNKVWFTTNLAKPLSEDVFVGWAHSGMHHINVSLDTMDPELFGVLRKFGRYEVFKRNLDTMARIFRDVPEAPKLRYITMAFKSNLEEIPKIVEHSSKHWMACENEIRYTYNVQHITDQFRQEHYLDSNDWERLTALLKPLPYPHIIGYPPDDGTAETLKPSQNYFDINKIRKTGIKPVFKHPLSLRARPDGTIFVVNQEDQFEVNIRDLEDPARFLRAL